MFTLKFHNDWANNNMAGSNFAKSKIKISYETICFPFLVCGTRTRIYILVYDFKQTYCFQFWYHKIVILCLIFKVFSGVDPRIPQTGGGHPSRPYPLSALYTYTRLWPVNLRFTLTYTWTEGNIRHWKLFINNINIFLEITCNMTIQTSTVPTPLKVMHHHIIKTNFGVVGCNKRQDIPSSPIFLR